MTLLNQYTGIVIPINISNIDTDVIIPKQFLKKINKKGFGKYLFYNWRFNDNEGKNINKNFILNDFRYKKSSILLTGDNFGCGSSREHAVWALMDYGFKVIIASSFGDIFYNNCLNNHLIPIILSENKINALFDITSNYKNVSFTIDLQNNTILAKNYSYHFKIDALHKFCIMHQLDKIDLTIKNEEKITKYEKKIFDFFIKK
ncbi:3-isopropylmalate dehydratase small subunit [Buchnera aphidicola (Pemphigus obesinymphae)]|uniref:3-isopropylmalate dehydratase small subunit n=1 Tax=Buchnera aphidicola TaxID=9 RepID=UPI0022387E9B|nr:3-isopropylmalate dehydratase small subunit [Buchnera aphidicola]MCW5196735.1 3-isopropylmalate dehydratase small subunit [Buchnera aphidicola (Pemphigus obesinymphae)]